MPSSFTCLSMILHIALVSSSVLQHQNQKVHGLVLASTPDSTIEAHPSSDPWPAIPALNISHPLFNSSLTEHNLTASPLPTPDCNGQLYGHDLDYESCFEAWKLIPRDILGRTFGSRSDDYTFDVPTPFLFMSSNGLCSIQIDLHSDDPYEVATGYDLGINGLNVLRTCVQKPPNKGGMVEGVGNSKRLALEMRAQTPLNVKCMDATNPAPTPGACQAALRQMPASVDPQIFGHRGDPKVEVELPFSFTAPNKACIINISTTTTSSSSRAAWYALYYAATAIDAKCVRHGRGGVATALGDPGTLVVSLEEGGLGAEGVATA